MTSSPRDVPPPPEPYRYAAQPAPEGATRPRWSAGRTAVVAGVTIVLVSAGAIAAAAALPLGASRDGSQAGFPGGGQLPRFRQGFGGFGGNGFGQQQNGQQQNGFGSQNGVGSPNGFGQQQNGPGLTSQQNGAQLPQLPSLGGRAGTPADDMGQDGARDTTT